MQDVGFAPGAGGEALSVSARPPRLLAIGLVTVAVAGLVGLGLGLDAIVSPSRSHASVVREPPSATAWRADASFGPIAAERVERSLAHTFDAHHGSTDARSDKLVVRVRLRNRGGRDIPFSPGQFRLEAVDAGTTVTAIDPSPPPGSIAAGKTLRTDVAFLVGVAHRRFALVFQDALSSRRIRIALGLIPAPQAAHGAAGETE
jgi:hypothetical protein